MTDVERHLLTVIINILGALGAKELNENAFMELHNAADAAGISRQDLLDAIKPGGGS